MVVLVHATDVAHWAWFGSAGVDIFFVLSGVVIYQSARGTDAVTFLRRRFVRVVPIYFLLTLAWLPIAFVIGDKSALSPPSLGAAFTFWPLWPNFVMPPLPQGWSLSFELLFYLAAAFALATRPAIYFIAAAFIASWCLRDSIGWWPFYFIGNPIILEFCFGLAIGAYALRPLGPRLAVTMVGVGFALIVLMSAGPNLYSADYIFNGELAGIRVLVWGLPAALIVRGAIGLEPHLKNLRPLVYLGDASFSIYLIHGPVVIALGAMNFSPAVLFVLSIMAGIGVYEIVEKPLLRLIQPQDRKPPVKEVDRRAAVEPVF